MYSGCLANWIWVPLPNPCDTYTDFKHQVSQYILLLETMIGISSILLSDPGRLADLLQAVHEECLVSCSHRSHTFDPFIPSVSIVSVL